MRKLISVLLCCVLIAAALSALFVRSVAVRASGTQLMTSAFIPLTIPANGCASGHTGAASQAFCDHQYTVLPNATGILMQIVAQTVDTGDCSGSVCTPNANFATADAKYVMFHTGYTITSISTTAGTATAVMSGGVYETGDWICNQGTSIAAYNNCFQLTGATYTGNTLTQVQWVQGGSPASATGGHMLESCGANITGYGANVCRIEILIIHNTGTGPNQGLPASGYPMKQAWANQVCTLHTWVANANHPIQDCLWVARVGHFYHATGLCATFGYCTSGATQPGTWNTSGSTTTDGTVTWQDDGATNALPLEVVTDSTAYPGISGTPSAAVFNINSVSCGGACSVLQAASGDPMIWEWPFLAWINGFNNSAIAHYAGVAWASLIDYIRLGVNGGGEIFQYASVDVTTNYGFSGSQFSYIYAAAGVATYTNNSAAWGPLAPPWTMMASLNLYKGGCSPVATCAILPTQLAAGAMALPGYGGIGSQGLQAADLTGWAAGNNPIVSNDFVPIAMQYWKQAKWLEQQTLKDSAGPGSSGCSSGQSNTGPLTPLLIFATQHRTNAFEIYATDWLATNDANYVAGTTYGSGCSPYPSGYGTALANAAAGNPSSTSGIGGHAGRGGNSGRN